MRPGVSGDGPSLMGVEVRASEISSAGMISMGRVGVAVCAEPLKDPLTMRPKAARKVLEFIVRILLYRVTEDFLFVNRESHAIRSPGASSAHPRIRTK